VKRKKKGGGISKEHDETTIIVHKIVLGGNEGPVGQRGKPKKVTRRVRKEKSSFFGTGRDAYTYHNTKKGGPGTLEKRQNGPYRQEDRGRGSLRGGKR